MLIHLIKLLQAKCDYPLLEVQFNSVSKCMVLQVTPTHSPSLASQTHFCKKRGLVNCSCIHRPCPATLYSVVQSRCSILQNDALHHCLSSNSNLEKGERALGHLFCYRSCKTLTIPLRECAYSATANSRVHYLIHHPANCIPVGHGLYMQFTRPFPLFAEVGLVCETNTLHPPSSAFV